MSDRCDTTRQCTLLKGHDKDHRFSTLCEQARTYTESELQTAVGAAWAEAISVVLGEECALAEDIAKTLEKRIPANALVGLGVRKV